MGKLTPLKLLGRPGHEDIESLHAFGREINLRLERHEPRTPPCDCSICEQNYLSLSRQHRWSYDDETEAESDEEAVLDELQTPGGRPTRYWRSDEDIEKLRQHISDEDGFIRCPVIYDRRFRIEWLTSKIKGATWNGSPLEVQVEARFSTLSREIESLYTRLGRVIKLHGNEILRRWCKKSQVARQQILEQACPDMFPYQWLIPHIQALSKPIQVFGGLKLELERVKRAALTPWLDMSSLKKEPDQLIALLHYRSAFHPSKWVSHDYSHTRYSWNTKHAESSWSPRCVVVTEENYGEITDWKPEAAHRLDVIGIPRAEMLFLAQRNTLEDLGKICQAIVGNSPSTVRLQIEARLGNSCWMNHVDKGFKLRGSTALWSKCTHHAVSAPTQPSIRKMLDSVVARKDEIASHLEFLQCDPLYLQSWLEKSFAHINPGDYPKRFFKCIYTELGSYCSWAKYESLFEAALKLESQQTEASTIEAQRLLSQAGFHSNNVIKSFSDNSTLGDSLCSGRFKKHWKNANDPITGDQGWCFRWKHHDFQGLFEEDPLFWCIRTISVLAPLDRSMDFVGLLRMLEDLMRDPKIPMDDLDPDLLRRLADITGAHEIYQELNLYRPYIDASLNPAEGYEYFSSWRPGIMAKTFAEGKKHSDRCDLDALADKILNEEISTTMGKFAKIAKTFLDDFIPLKPPPKSQAKLWLKYMDASRLSMSKFWKAARACLFQTRLLNSSVKLVLSFDISPQHRVFVERERRQIIARIDQDQEIQRLEAISQKKRKQATQRFSSDKGIVSATDQPQTSWFQGVAEAHDQPRASFTKPKEKGKTKTRPAVDHEAGLTTLTINEQPAEDDADINDQIEPLPKIPSTKRALDIIESMYPQDIQDRARGYNWDAFVHAMGDLGFKASNCGGSVVAFELPTPPKRTPEQQQWRSQRINIHRPHPSSKMDEIMLQSIGKRMSRLFGWRRERFVAAAEAGV